MTIKRIFFVELKITKEIIYILKKKKKIVTFRG
jgi:hypothetical protein